MNFDLKIKNNLNTNRNLSTQELKPNNQKRSIFTLNDGIKLLKSNINNIPSENIAKSPNLKIGKLQNKLYAEKDDENKKKNILTIDSIKGKSIFNNSILDNVLGTILINSDEIMKKKNGYMNSQLIKKTNSNSIYHRDKTPDYKYIDSDLKFKTICDLSKEENINITNNEYNYKKTSNIIMDMDMNDKNQIITLNRKISSCDENYNNLPLLVVNSNLNKRSDYSNNLHIRNENKNEFRLIKNRKINEPIDVLEYKLDNISHVNDYNVNRFNNEKYGFKNNLNYTLYKPLNPLNFKTRINLNSHINQNDSKFLSTSINYKFKSTSLLHNKELKFQLYKHNKLQDLPKDVNNNTISVTNRFKIDINKNNKEENLNTLEDRNKTMGIEASTQTRINLSTVFDENTYRTFSENENLQNNIYNKTQEYATADNQIKVLGEEEDFYSIKEKNKNLNRMLNEEKSFLDNYRTKTQFNKNAYVKNEVRSRIVLADSNSFIYLNTQENEFNKNDDYAQRKFNSNFNETKQKDSKNFYTKSNNFYNKTIKNQNFFSNLNNTRFISNIENEKNMKNSFNSKANSDLYRPQFASSSSSALNPKAKNIERLNEVNNFTKELFQNSKILRENFINTTKSKNKSQTSLRVNDNPNSKKLINIKYSKNVQM